MRVGREGGVFVVVVARPVDGKAPTWCRAGVAEAAELDDRAVGQNSVEPGEVGAGPDSQVGKARLVLVVVGAAVMLVVLVEVVVVTGSGGGGGVGPEEVRKALFAVFQ